MKKTFTFVILLLIVSFFGASCQENVIEEPLPVHNLVEVSVEIKTAEGTSSTELNENSVMTFDGDKMVVLSNGKETIYDLTNVSCIRFDSIK